MKSISLLVSSAVTASVLLACSESTSTLPEMGVSFQFEEKHRCSTISPAITLSNVPAESNSFQVKLTDLDVRSYNHGGGTANIQGNVIPEGALNNYKGPCPPNGTHTYRFSVKAISVDGKPLASGQAQQEF